ncbi:acetyltransferase [Acinetobacter sp. YH12035]|uniref:acetyltransferase n=1 Tax=Acinetobacter sp. YH12035 TaxID=2601045 RepID=UPI0015D41A2F|nr:acetyltransferase [Acinetobacter sp. YH12035]
MSKKNLLILGAGGFGHAIAEIAQILDRWECIYFVDDRWPKQKQAGCYSIISNIKNLESIDYNNFDAIVAVGNNQVRQKWHHLILDLAIPLTRIIHPNTVISPSVKIGQGVCIMAGCVIGANTIIQDGVILNIGTLLDHDVIVGNFAHLSVGVKVASNNIIPASTFLEVGSIMEHKA